MNDHEVVISSKDEKLRHKVDACIDARQRFVIRADSTFRHHDALIRWLDVYSGQPERRGFFRILIDNVVAGDILGSWAATVQDANYSWDFDVKSKSVAITFDPDPDALRPKLSLAFKNKSRQKQGSLLKKARQGDIHVISMNDETLRKKVVEYTAKSQPFIIQADHAFRHKKALVRWLRVYDGESEERGFGRFILDNLLAGRIAVYMQIARNAGYTWAYDEGPDAVTILFEPTEPSVCSDESLNPPG